MRNECERSWTREKKNRKSLGGVTQVEVAIDRDMILQSVSTLVFRWQHWYDTHPQKRHASQICEIEDELGCLRALPLVHMIPIVTAAILCNQCFCCRALDVQRMEVM
jgi:hypothetical protein